MPTNEEIINLVFYKGATVTKRFVCRDVKGAPKDLSGFAIKSQARLSPTSSGIIYDIDIIDGQFGSDFENGIVVLRVPIATTASMPPQCSFDVRATSGDVSFPIARGRITLVERVTR